MRNENNNVLIDSVKNYLSMDSSGALMVTGQWGCGKTYFFKNVLANELKNMQVPEDDEMEVLEDYQGWKLVMVSLFGVHCVDEIPERVCFAYTDSFLRKKIMKNLIGTLKKVNDSVPFTKQFVDISNLNCVGRGIYHMLPKKKVVLCFDDVERALEVLDINEVLGVVNDLVENIGLKVIIIANEGVVNDLLSEKKFVFKEKVIEKTIAFVPNIINVFKEIVGSIGDNEFLKFMTNDDIIKTINPDDGLSKDWVEYRNNILNIRTLKFAIVHFYKVYNHCKNETYEQKDIKLKNYWYYILAISIEYKNNHITFENDRTLRTYVYNEKSIEFGDNIVLDQDSIFDDQKEIGNDKNQDNLDDEYVHRFYDQYYIKQKEYPIRHCELYNFITGGVSPNYKKLDCEMNESLKRYIHENDLAYDVYGKIINWPWTYTEEQIKTLLLQLYQYVESGAYNYYYEYFNAYSFLNQYKDAISISEQALNKSFEEGIDKLFEKIEITRNTILDLEMYKDHYSKKIGHIYNYIVNTKIPEKEKKQYNKSLLLLEEDFQHDLETFNKKLLNEFNNIPILADMESLCIQKKISNLEVKDIYYIESLLKSRYLNRDLSTGLVDMIEQEYQFIDILKNAVNSLKLNEPKVLNIQFKKYILPKLEKIEHEYYIKYETKSED